jgi:hypothetical protein
MDLTETIRTGAQKVESTSENPVSNNLTSNTNQGSNTTPNTPLNNKLNSRLFFELFCLFIFIIIIYLIIVDSFVTEPQFITYIVGVTPIPSESFLALLQGLITFTSIIFGFYSIMLIALLPKIIDLIKVIKSKFSGYESLLTYGIIALLLLPIFLLIISISSSLIATGYQGVLTQNLQNIPKNVPHNISKVVSSQQFINNITNEKSNSTFYNNTQDIYSKVVFDTNSSITFTFLSSLFIFFYVITYIVLVYLGYGKNDST